MKQVMKEEFIEKARKIHGDRYDYSKVKYVNSKTKVCIICPIHGEFWQTPDKHLRGHKCPLCSKTKPKQWDEVYKTFIEKHGSQFDYSKVDFKNMNTKVYIIHKDCKNGFWQTPKNHIKGHGCPYCKNNKISKKLTKTTERFIEECKNVHKNAYDYSKVKYTSSKDKICIICHRKDKNGFEHGEFWQEANSHLSGCGCPKCGMESAVNHKKEIYTTERFIEISQDIHKGKWLYNDKTVYVSAKTPICIICPVHGEFWQTPDKHLSGCGCPKCGGTKKLSNKEFIVKAREVHGDKYDYSKVEYIDAHTKVCIICPEHGEFFMTPNTHLNGCGCPSCSHKVSKDENEIYNFVKKYCDTKVEHNVRGILSNNRELDIFIPQKKIAIEYNGMRWHSEQFQKDKNYHLNKLEECNRKGISLIQIFEKEYITNKEILLKNLLHIIGCPNFGTKIEAKNCIVKEIGKKTTKKFLEMNDIQGYVASTLHLGLYHKEQIIDIMTFKKLNNNIGNEWQITRYVNDINYIVKNSFDAIFNYFIDNYKPNVIKCFVDRRWLLDKRDDLYVKNGFVLDKIIKPDYRYTRTQNEYINKSSFKKEFLHKKYDFPLTMPISEMLKNIGYYKIWDCGRFLYRWEENNETSYTEFNKKR